MKGDKTMIKTRDGYEVEVGMWVSDTTGVYEVQGIDAMYVDLREVFFHEDGSGDYTLIGRRRLLHSELRHMDYL